MIMMPNSSCLAHSLPLLVFLIRFLLLSFRINLVDIAWTLDGWRTWGWTDEWKLVNTPLRDIEIAAGAFMLLWMRIDGFTEWRSRWCSTTQHDIRTASTHPKAQVWRITYREKERNANQLAQPAMVYHVIRDSSIESHAARDGLAGPPRMRNIGRTSGRNLSTAQLVLEQFLMASYVSYWLVLYLLGRPVIGTETFMSSGYVDVSRATLYVDMYVASAYRYEGGGWD